MEKYDHVVINDNLKNVIIKYSILLKTKKNFKRFNFINNHVRSLLR